jgi:putative solute:sodium symporter small subunit
MAQELKGLDKQKLADYWSYNVKLTAFTMIVWFVVTYVAIFFAPQLDKIVILGFPMGYYMGAQGSLIVFVILIFNYAFKMNKADKDYGVEEEEE